MSRYRCRRDHCDGIAAVAGGLCKFHLSPPDLDLAAQYEGPWPAHAYRWVRDDDAAPMSSTEKYWHQENE